MKALKIMQESTSVINRAGEYATTIHRHLKRSIIDALTDEKDKLVDEISSQLDFSLQTDLNRGVQPLTRDECEKRFNRVQELEYQLVLLNLEIAAKERIFAKYFADEAV